MNVEWDCWNSDICLGHMWSLYKNHILQLHIWVFHMTLFRDIGYLLRTLYLSYLVVSSWEELKTDLKYANILQLKNMPILIQQINHKQKLRMPCSVGKMGFRINSIMSENAFTNNHCWPNCKECQTWVTTERILPSFCKWRKEKPFTVSVFCFVIFMPKIKTFFYEYYPKMLQMSVRDIYPHYRKLRFSLNIMWKIKWITTKIIL